jgi:hypothetical protein
LTSFQKHPEFLFAPPVETDRTMAPKPLHCRETSGIPETSLHLFYSNNSAGKMLEPEKTR